MPVEYVLSDTTEEYNNVGLPKVSALVGGKDYPCDTIRKNNAIKRCQYSDKSKADCFRDITWSSKCVLVHTYILVVQLKAHW